MLSHVFVRGGGGGEDAVQRRICKKKDSKISFWGFWLLNADLNLTKHVTCLRRRSFHKIPQLISVRSAVIFHLDLNPGRACGPSVIWKRFICVKLRAIVPLSNIAGARNERVAVLRYPQWNENFYFLWNWRSIKFLGIVCIECYPLSVNRGAKYLYKYILFM